MRIRRLTTLLALAGLALACEQRAAEETGETVETTEPTVDVAAEEEALHALADRYENAFAAKDVEALSAMWTDDAVWIRHDGTEVSGGQALRDAYTQQFAATGTQTFQVDPVETVVAESGDVAYERGTYTVRSTTADGTPIEETYRYLVTFRKEDGDWKLAYAMDTAPLAAAGETVADTGAMGAPPGP